MNLNQVTISVKDVEKSIEFYQRLGLELIVKALPHYARFVCPVGNATFSLHQDDKIEENKGTWIYFEIESLDKKVEELIEKGFIFDEMPNDKTWLWREAYLTDLDQNRIILYFAGENRLNPPWRIKEAN